MSASEFVGMCSSVTVAQIMEHDDFSNRFKDHVPIALHEILYPILQARDSVFIDCDVELGGNDQFFNCLLGRDVMSHVGMSPQVVVLTPILTGLDGRSKMSQSLDNFVSIRDVPFDMFGKVMSIRDADITRWAQVPGFEQLEQDWRSGTFNPKLLKKELAFKIVEMCWSTDEATLALRDFEQKFEKRDWQAIAPEIKMAHDKNTTHSLASLLVEWNMATTNSEARRLIRDGAVEIEGEKITNPMFVVSITSLVGKHVKVGKKKFAKLA